MSVATAPRFEIPADKRIGFFPRFREIVRERNLSLKDLSEASGIDGPSVLRMFWGEKPSLADSIIRVIAALNAAHHLDIDFDREFRELVDDRYA